MHGAQFPVQENPLKRIRSFFRRFPLYIRSPRRPQRDWHWPLLLPTFIAAWRLQRLKEIGVTKAKRLSNITTPRYIYSVFIPKLI